jgi:hypothetical protein
MSNHRFGELGSMLAQRSRAVWICSLAGLFLVALSAGAGGRAPQGQTEEPTTAVPSQEPATAVPSPPSAMSKPKPAPKPEAQQPESATAVRPEAAPLAPLDDSQKAVADASANLLELANSLKREVDKTSADTLSVAVVRKAAEIEQLARKMRTR